MIEILNNIFFFVVALGILVAVHEWGHYYVAKLCGVKILRFSIGFGKPIYQRVTSAGMQFVIAAIPLGGYVRMLDGRVDDVTPAEQQVAFNYQPVWQRIAIVAAGPAVNFIFAVFASMIIGLIGFSAPKPVIQGIEEDSFMYHAGVQPLDQIVAIDGKSTQDWREVVFQLSTFSGEQNMPFTVMSENGLQKNLVAPINGWKIDPDEPDLLGAFGIQRYLPEVTTTIAMVSENTPAAIAGIKVNDEILEINGTTQENWSQMVEIIEANPNETVTFLVSRNDVFERLEVTFGEHPDRPGVGYLGVVPYREAFPDNFIHQVQYGIFGALAYGVQEMIDISSLTLTMLGKLIIGDVSVKNLSGPVSIAQGAGNSASAGLIAFLSFLALISVNLGIINLLPVPMLDGGHLVYFFVEWVTGKPVSESVQEIGMRIGGLLILALMATAIFNDIVRNI
ncbi:MAG: RIP metalloprotease RseP [Pseudomonadota bacterium]